MATNKEEPLWKRTKEICDEIAKLDGIEELDKTKIIYGLTPLLFYKDYSNCFVHK